MGKRRDPVVSFRIPRAYRQRLLAVSKIYGAVSLSVFMRELTMSVFTDNAEGPGTFLRKLGMAMGQQRQLDLFAQAKREARKRAQAPRKPSVEGEGAAPP